MCDLAPILILRLELCVTALREHKRGWKVHPSWAAPGQQGQSAALHASNVPLTLAGTLQGRDCWPHFRKGKMRPRDVEGLISGHLAQKPRYRSLSPWGFLSGSWYLLDTKFTKAAWDSTLFWSLGSVLCSTCDY